MKPPVYERHKDSGVEWLGQVPAHWPVKAIKHLLRRDGYKAGPFGSALITASLADHGDVLVLTPEHIANSSLVHDFNQYLPSEREPEMSAFRVSVGDVVFPIVGTLGRALVIKTPDLASEIMGAVMDALTAHTAMSKQALESERLRADMKDVLLGAGKLWEGLREKALGSPV